MKGIGACAPRGKASKVGGFLYPQNGGSPLEYTQLCLTLYPLYLGLSLVDRSIRNQTRSFLNLNF